VILPITPDVVEVMGSRWTYKTEAWHGLDFARAELRETSTLMEWVCSGKNVPKDYHLRTPFLHPRDVGLGWDFAGCWYRVRPRRKRDKFVMVDGAWMLDRHEPKRRIHLTPGLWSIRAGSEARRDSDEKEWG
jgi:hypothetical protein